MIRVDRNFLLASFPSLKLSRQASFPLSPRLTSPHPGRSDRSRPLSAHDLRSLDPAWSPAACILLSSATAPAQSPSRTAPSTRIEWVAPSLSFRARRCTFTAPSSSSSSSSLSRSILTPSSNLVAPPPPTPPPPFGPPFLRRLDGAASGLLSSRLSSTSRTASDRRPRRRYAAASGLTRRGGGLIPCAPSRPPRTAAAASSGRRRSSTVLSLTTRRSWGLVGSSSKAVVELPLSPASVELVDNSLTSSPPSAASTWADSSSTSTSSTVRLAPAALTQAETRDWAMSTTREAEAGDDAVRLLLPPPGVLPGAAGTAAAEAASTKSPRSASP
mmetsp:Transcript_3902/g.8722  ORF Transcript_3902/g.8722 Transcript_3902/m.8722 type:complete len:330 (+) Transcript_3902:80-1069(+)